MDRLDEYRARGRLLGAALAQITISTGLSLTDDEVVIAYQVRNDLLTRRALEQQDAGATLDESAEFHAAANRRYFEVLDEYVVCLREAAARPAPVPPAPSPPGNRRTRRAAKAKAGLH